MKIIVGISALWMLFACAVHAQSTGHAAAVGVVVDDAGIIRVSGTGNSAAGLNMETVAYDAEGNQVETAVYDGGNGNDVAVASLPDPAGGFYLIGFSRRAEGPYDPMVLHYEGEASDVPVDAAFPLMLKAEPNPVAASTVIRYRLPERSRVTLAVHDALGRTIATLVEGTEAPGDHAAVWDAGEQPDGMYVLLLTVEAGSTRRTMPVRLVKVAGAGR